MTFEKEFSAVFLTIHSRNCLNYLSISRIYQVFSQVCSKFENGLDWQFKNDSRLLKIYDRFINYMIKVKVSELVQIDDKTVYLHVCGFVIVQTLRNIDSNVDSME